MASGIPLVLGLGTRMLLGSSCRGVSWGPDLKDAADAERPTPEAGAQGPAGAPGGDAPRG